MNMQKISYCPRFLRRLGGSPSLLRLFDFLDQVYFYAKDEQHRFVAANVALARLRRVSHPQRLIGKTDFELGFHAEHWGLRYQEENERVMATGEAVIDRVWLVTDEHGQLVSFRSTKIPLIDERGSCVGIAGLLVPLEQGSDARRTGDRLEPVLAEIRSRYAEKLDVDILAAVIGLSSSQLNRLFQSRYQISTTEYILRYRVHLASAKLRLTEQTIGEIAVDHGFYDQAHFTRVFKHWLGTTPNQYRRDSRNMPANKLFDGQ